MKKLFFSALFSCIMYTAFGHALWMETAVNGKKGQPQEVKIFLGEYADNERDSIQHWFSNMRDFKLYLIDPSGQKQLLSCTPAGNHFRATFTPTSDGVYTLYIDHVVQEVYSGSKIHYYAQGLVRVNDNKSTGNLKQNTFIVQTANTATGKKNNAEQVTLLHQSKSTLPNAELTVQSPEGWTKKMKASNKGEAFAYTPAWSGRYLLEGTFIEEEKGEHEGKPYERVWHCVTYCKDVTN